MSPKTNTTNGTANNTANSSHWIGGDNGGVLGGVAPSGWEMLESAMKGLAKSFSDGVASLLDMFNRGMLTLPAAGEPMKPATWATVDDPFWIASFTVYAMLSAFILPLVWGVGFFNVGYSRNKSRRDRVKKLAWALVLVLAGWELLMFWFHFWNEAALAFTPGGMEFLHTPGNISKLGVGVFLGVLLIIFHTSVVLIGLGIHLLFVLFTFMFVALWPLSVGLYVSDMFVTESIGTSGIIATLVLAPLQFIKALVLRLIFEFPLKPDNPETAVSFILIAVGVTVAFIGIPWYGLKRLLPRSVVATGRQARQRAEGSDRMEEFSDRVPSGEELRAKVTDVSSGAKSRLSSRLGGDSGTNGSKNQTRTRDSALSKRRRTSRSRSNSTDTRSRTANNRSDDD